MTTYWDYLKINELLALQHGSEPAGQDVSPDELHFIVVHQVFELWFKLILSEIRRARGRLLADGPAADVLPPVLDSLHRINRTLTVAVQHWDVMETMSPQDFLLFRDKLVPASGFQSFQFPEMEIVLGLEETLMMTTGERRSLAHLERAAVQSGSGASAWAVVSRARAEPTFRSALYRWLADRSLLVRDSENVDATVDRFGDAYLVATKTYFDQQVDQLLRDPGASRPAVEATFNDNYRLAEHFIRGADVPAPHRPRLRRLRAALLYIETYHDVPALTLERRLIDAVLDLESLLVLWRTRHARMAEKVIGRRVGTGGASVDYLNRTLNLRVFPDLWESRTQVVPRHLAPGDPWARLSRSVP